MAWRLFTGFFSFETDMNFIVPNFVLDTTYESVLKIDHAVCVLRVNNARSADTDGDKAINSIDDSFEIAPCDTREFRDITVTS